MAKFVSVPAFADHIGLAPNTVYTACRRGEIPGAFLVGRRWRINIDAYEAAQMAAVGVRPTGTGAGESGDVSRQLADLASALREAAAGLDAAAKRLT